VCVRACDNTHTHTCAPIRPLFVAATSLSLPPLAYLPSPQQATAKTKKDGDGEAGAALVEMYGREGDDG
jgi:hypothetical protein